MSPSTLFTAKFCVVEISCSTAPPLHLPFSPLTFLLLVLQAPLLPHLVLQAPLLPPLVLQALLLPPLVLPAPLSPHLWGFEFPFDISFGSTGFTDLPNST